MKWRQPRKSCELLRTLLDRTFWCTAIGIDIGIGVLALALALALAAWAAWAEVRALR